MVIVDHHRDCADDIIDNGYGGDIDDGGHDEKDGYAGHAGHSKKVDMEKIINIQSFDEVFEF